MKKYFLLPLLVYYLVSNVQAQEKIKLSSPNGEIKVSVRLTDKIYYDVACNDEVLLKDNYLQLKLKDKILGEHPKLSHLFFSIFKTSSCGNSIISFLSIFPLSISEMDIIHSLL